MTAIKWLTQPTSILPLVVFRISFGVLMFVSTLRFILKGWVHEFYIAPSFHFTYWGFGWVQPLSGVGMYVVFAALLLLTLCITLGVFYRASMALFFLLFSYVELLDKTYYLNHYYFISLLSFLLIFLPMNRAFSLDARRGGVSVVPRWMISAIQLQVGIVYFFAGVAKLNPDWLFEAMPLTVWLRANTDFPVLGQFFDERWLHFAMSWMGAGYDLTIPFFLLWRRTRPLAYLAVIAFHTMTGMLFPIGMFPWVMIVCTLIFFSAADYKRVLGRRHWPHAPAAPHYLLPRPVMVILGVFFLFQMLFPLRHWLYPGDVLWTEEGYRFSWNVMLAEKTGMALFHVIDAETGQRWIVFPNEYLTPQQEKQMSFQPDMILQFAHFLADIFRTHGHSDIRVTVDSFVSLNGRPSQRFIQEGIDLTRLHNSIFHKEWITQAASSP